MDAAQRQSLLAEIVTCRRGRVKVIIAQLTNDLKSEEWLKDQWANYRPGRPAWSARPSGRTVLTKLVG